MIEKLIRFHAAGRAVAEVQYQAELALTQGNHDAHMRWGAAFHRRPTPAAPQRVFTPEEISRWN